MVAQPPPALTAAGRNAALEHDARRLGLQAVDEQQACEGAIARVKYVASRGPRRRPFPVARGWWPPRGGRRGQRTWADIAVRWKILCWRTSLASRWKDWPLTAQNGGYLVVREERAGWACPGSARLGFCARFVAMTLFCNQASPRFARKGLALVSFSFFSAPEG